MPGPYRVAVGEVGGMRGVRRGKYLLAHRAEKLYTDIIIMYGWNEP